ncbi:MAG: hypothetical protein AAFS11_02305, partial [Planctomycetota bacterium]
VPSLRYSDQMMSHNVTRVLVTVCCMGCLAVLAGCRFSITPPASPADPVTVYLVDYGDTSRVWLPAAEPGSFVEWGYGDWRWYANDKKSLLYGAVIFIWPTDGAIARREWAGSPWASTERDRPRDEIDGYATWVYELPVERSASDALLASLQARYDAQIETQIYNERRETWFVRDDTSYWLGHQSSSVMADWLEELGADASGFTVKARYRVREPGMAYDVRPLADDE